MSVLRLTAVSLATLVFLMRHAVAGAPPTSFDSVYDVSSGGLTIGEMTRRFHINAADGHGNTLLIVAAQNNRLRAAQLLLRKGANTDHQNVSVLSPRAAAAAAAAAEQPARC